MKIVAIVPGSFDPITNGHLDIIKRASKMFDKVIVLVLPNASKTATFSEDERIDFIKKSIVGISNVKVDCYEGLLANYAKENDANVIVKGLRAVTDFEYEFQMALINKKMNEDIETVFIPANEGNMYLSSSVVRQIGAMGGSIKDFVPKEVETAILKRLQNN